MDNGQQTSDLGSAKRGRLGHDGRAMKAGEIKKYRERAEDLMAPRLEELGEILTEYVGLLLQVRRKRKKVKKDERKTQNP